MVASETGRANAVPALRRESARDLLQRPDPVDESLPAMPATPVEEDPPEKQTGENTCPRCAGRGTLPDGARCPACDGSGIVIEPVGDA